MGKYIMALDAGTTSNRCILFDQKGQIVSLAQKEFTQRFPKPGWVEHDANEIWSTMLGVAVEAMQKAGASYEDIAAIGITNQRETTIVWDKKTGEPVYNAIVWQCRRTSEYCDSLMERGLVDRFREKTGLVIDAYFSATKLKWILDEVPGVRERAERGDLYFGTVETWLIWKMTKGKVHVTDYTNASRTMLFNIHTLKWDEDILKEMNIPLCMLPEVRPSSCVYGETASTYFGGPIPIAGAAGDQQAALFGQTCYAPGEAKNTYGTGCFLLMNTGEKPVSSTHGLVTTIAWGIGDKITYALEGSFSGFQRQPVFIFSRVVKNQSYSVKKESLYVLRTPLDVYSPGAFFIFSKKSKPGFLLKQEAVKPCRIQNDSRPGDGRSGIMADDGLSFADCFFGNMLTLKASVCKGLLDRGNNAGAVLTHQLDYFAKNNIK